MGLVSGSVRLPWVPRSRTVAPQKKQREGNPRRTTSRARRASSATCSRLGSVDVLHRLRDHFTLRGGDRWWDRCARGAWMAAAAPLGGDGDAVDPLIGPPGDFHLARLVGFAEQD